MKNILSLLIITLLFTGCIKKNEEPQLPPITHTGANTFGCKINGEVFTVSGKRFQAATDGVWTSIGRPYWIVEGKLGHKSVDLQFAVDTNLMLPASFPTNGIYPSISYFFDFKDGTLPGAGNQYQTDSLHTGSIYISTLTTASVSGTFQLDVINGNGNVVHITEGRFDIAF